MSAQAICRSFESLRSLRMTTLKQYVFSPESDAHGMRNLPSGVRAI